MKILKFLLFLLVTVATFSTGCNLLKKAQATSQDAVAQHKDSAIALQIANLYALVISSPDKSYSAYQAEYIAIGDNLNTLLSYDSARKNSSALLIIVNDISSRFNTYRQEHITYGSLNNAQALAFKEGMDALFSILLRTEANYKP